MKKIKKVRKLGRGVSARYKKTGEEAGEGGGVHPLLPMDKGIQRKGEGLQKKSSRQWETIIRRFETNMATFNFDFQVV